MLRSLRRRVGQWVFKDRVRLGEGEGLEPLTPQDLEGIRRRFPRPKFFIFGHARSGTSFLGRMIRVHPDVHCKWQIQYFSNRGAIPYFTAPGFQHWLRNSSNRWLEGWNPTSAMLRVCCDMILERDAEAAGKPIVGDKSPNGNGAQAIRWLAAVYPDARLIYIVRDGRDTVLSRRIQNFIDSPQNLSRADRRIREAFIRDPRPFYERRTSIFSPVWLKKSAGRWARDVDECVRAGRELFGDRFAVVRFEDLLADPAPHLRDLWTFLGAGPQPAGLDATIAQELHKNPEADWHASFGFDFLQKLPRGVHGGWQSLFTDADARLFEQEARATLEAHRYQNA